MPQRRRSFIPYLAAAMLLSGAAAAQESYPPTTGADFLACRGAKDEGVCLLRFSARVSTHTSFADNIDIAYAPDVLAELKDAETGSYSLDMLSHRSSTAAIEALKLSHAGAAPEAALAPIRDLHLAADGDPTRAEGRANLERIWQAQAYQALVDAGEGRFRIPPPNRPSPALVEAAMRAWIEVMTRPGRRIGMDEMIEALHRRGETAAAQAFARSLARDDDLRTETLLKVGLLEEAARSAVEAAPEPPGMDQDFGQRSVMLAADAAKRPDLAVKVAREVVKEVRQPTALPHDHAAALATALITLAKYAPHDEAAKAIGDVEAETRVNPATAPTRLTAAAILGWKALGETRRAQALQDQWTSIAKSALPPCTGSQLACRFQDPSVVLKSVLSLADPNGLADAIQAAAGPPAFAAALRAGDEASAEAQIAAAPAAQRRDMIYSCAEGGDAQYALSARCARRLVSEPPPSGADGTEAANHDLRAILLAASRAAEDGQAAPMHALMNAAYDLVSRWPMMDFSERVTYLGPVGIMMLREQGRL